MIVPPIKPLWNINVLVNQVLLVQRNRTDENYDKLVDLLRELKHELVEHEIQKIKNEILQLKEELLTKQTQLSKSTLDTNKIIESKNIQLAKLNRLHENDSHHHNAHFIK